MLLFFANGFSQIVQKFGDDFFTIDPNAVLELQSTNKGLLLPRVTLTSSTSFAPLSAHVKGMIVYNTVSAGDVPAGIYINSGTAWVRVADSSSPIAVTNGGTGATTAAGALTNLGAQSTSNLSSNVTTNTGSTTMYPSISAVESYVASKATANATPDATTSVKGKVKLAGDLAGTADLPVVAAGAIDNSKIATTAAIADSKLATITTLGKVSNSATTATMDNTFNTIVLRDASGNFSAGAITATSFTGSGAGLTSVIATSFSGTLPVANGGTGVTASTGGGSVVLSTSPTLVTPVLGAATGTSLSVSGQLTSTIATGTAPFVVTSTTAVANLSIGGNAATATSSVTQTAGNNTTAIATTAFVTAAVTTAVNSPSVVTKTANYTATASDSTILCDTSSAADVEGYTLTLPTAAIAGSGKVYVIKKIDLTAKKLKFVPSFYISTSTTEIISSLNYVKTFRVQSDGTKWYIID